MQCGCNLTLVPKNAGRINYLRQYYRLRNLPIRAVIKNSNLKFSTESVNDSLAFPGLLPYPAV